MRLFTLASLVLSFAFIGCGVANASDTRQLECLHGCAGNYRACISRIYVPDLNKQKMNYLQGQCHHTDQACQDRCFGR